MTLALLRKPFPDDITGAFSPCAHYDLFVWECGVLRTGRWSSHGKPADPIVANLYMETSRLLR